MADNSSQPLLSVITSALAKLRYPKLFMVVAGLFFADLVIPDVIPFLDEILLAGLTMLLGNLRGNSASVEESDPPVKNVTPPNESE